MSKIYLTGRNQCVPGCCNPISVNLISRYLVESICGSDDDLAVDVLSYSCFNTSIRPPCGPVKMEILYYEKVVRDKKQELVSLYGIEENSRFQLRQFTLCFDTTWFTRTAYHVDDCFFDSLILEPADRLLEIRSSYLELSVLGSGNNSIGHCQASMVFAPYSKQCPPPADLLISQDGDSLLAPV